VSTGSLLAPSREESALAELARRRDLAAHVGGEDAIHRQQKRGLLTAPERVHRLLDSGTDIPFGPLVHADTTENVEATYGDGELAGFGRIEGRWVAYFASDARVKGASATPATFRHSDAFRRLAERAAVPMIHLMQGGGARMTDAMSSRFIAFPGTGLGARRTFPRRGVMLTAVLGNYFAPWTVAQADFSVMTETSNLSLTAPALVSIGTGQNVTAEELGGALVHAKTSGQIDAVVPDDTAAIAMIRRIFGYLPTHAGAPAPRVVSCEPGPEASLTLPTVVPTRSSEAYDIRGVIERIVDVDSFIEWSPRFAPNMVTGLARFAGRTVVLMANQPSALAGVVDINAVLKARKIVRLAADMDLPLVSIVDTPGVLPTVEQERGRLMSQLFDFASERLRIRAAKVTVVVRKGIGFALQVMSAGDPEGFTFAWPGAHIAFTSPEAAAMITYRREIDEALDRRAAARSLAERFIGGGEPWDAARLGYLDDVIDPSLTRRYVVQAIETGVER
jgi:acetyl-CoA carboxylase carboxyltransferase component